MQVSKAKKGYKFVDTGFGKEIEIPEEWKVTSLDSLTSLVTNGFVGKAKDHYTESTDGVPYIQGYNVTKNGFNLHGIKHVTKKFSEKQKKSRLETGDLLVIQTGDIGTTAIVTDEIAGANCHALIICRLKKQIADPYYYYQYFGSNSFQKSLRKIETGATLKHLNGGDMKKIELLCPPLSEQQKIGEILSNMNNTLNKTNHLIEKIGLIKKGLMQKLFTKGISHTKFKKVEWGYKRNIEIPEEWEFKSLDSLVFFQEGPGLRNWQFTKSGMKIINVGNIIDGKLDTSTTTRHISQKEFDEKYIHFELDEEDIVISSSGWSYGKVAVVKKIDLPLMLNTSVIRFKPLNDKIIQKFLYHFLNTKFFKKQIDYQITGIDIPNFGSSHLKKMKIILPPINEQQQIASILSNVDSQITKEKLNKANLELLKKGLMQKLLTGKIRVKV